MAGDDEEDEEERLRRERYLRWPERPSVAFGPSEPRGLNADVHWAQRYGNGWLGYVEGYARAASAVFDRAVRDCWSPEYVVWPLAFLWRHHVELALKDIIAAGRELQGEPDGFPAGHRLGDLWREAKPHIQRCGPASSPELDSVEAAIIEFETIDRAGDGFRYPLRRDQRGVSLPNAPEQVNLEQLQQVMERVSNFFSAVRTEIGVRLDFVRERAAEDR